MALTTQRLIVKESHRARRKAVVDFLLDSGAVYSLVPARTLVIVALLLAVAAAGPPVDAQQAPKIAKIGFLATSTPAAVAHLVEAFRQGLRQLGYVEGKTFVLEVRYGEARFERFPELARE